jgi:hypothetical protein
VGEHVPEPAGKSAQGRYHPKRLLCKKLTLTHKKLGLIRRNVQELSIRKRSVNGGGVPTRNRNCRDPGTFIELF